MNVPKPPPLDEQRLKRIRECQLYLDRLEVMHRDDAERVREIVAIGAWLILIEGDESW